MRNKLIAIICVFILSCGSVYAEYIEPVKERTLLSAMGIENVGQVHGGYVMNIDKRIAMELTKSQISSFVSEANKTQTYRRICKNPFGGLAIVLRTNKGDKCYFVGSGVQVGKYGDDNFFCYSPEDDMYCVGEIYADFMSSKSRYAHSVFNINQEYDYLIYPEEEWAVEDVLFAAKNSLLPYEICDSYGKAISREEFCILIANYLKVIMNFYNLEDYFSQNKTTYSENYFVDTNGRDKSINMLHAMGIISGKSKTEFHPSDALTREEAAVILKNTAYAAKVKLPVVNTYFYDKSSVSSWAIEAVNAVGYSKIMNGIDGSFKPKSFLTVEQAIAAVNRLYVLG